jgi:ATP-binding protein involved in chromosome partitioning
MPDDLLTNARILPANFGPLRGANANARITGPCGDTMEFWLRVDEGRIAQAAFTTDGCEHSTASGSAAARLAEGKTISEAASISQNNVLEAIGGLPKEFTHCALLAANALRAALARFREAHAQEAGECETCTSASCDAKTARPGERPDELEDRRALRRRLCRIQHKVIVLSGKGGVGKSTVAVNLAVSLAHVGRRVGLLDVDIHGPSVPTMLGLEGAPIQVRGDTIIPVQASDVRVMSIGFLLRSPDEAVIWRGPMKMGVIKQFLKDVEWGDLDYLVIDAPPGTGDEPLSVCQLIEDADGAVVVATPQEVALAAIRKSINFCRQLDLPVLGVVENMSELICPKCGEIVDLFGSGGAERMAEEMGVPFLGRVPITAAVAQSGDAGRPCAGNRADDPAARAFGRTAEAVRRTLEHDDPVHVT